jgi:hypothetical protein
MKFWELTSVFRENESQLHAILQAYGDRRYADWLQDISSIVSLQQREKLDAIVPNELCVAALKCHKGKLYQAGAQVRSFRLNASDEEISYFEVFRLYGGDFLEEVLEKGSAKR